MEAVIAETRSRVGVSLHRPANRRHLAPPWRRTAHAGFLVGMPSVATGSKSPAESTIATPSIVFLTVEKKGKLRNFL